MNKKTTIWKKFFSITLCLAMVLNCLSLSSILPLQADTYTYTGGAGNKVSDLDTSNKYNESLGDGLLMNMLGVFGRINQFIPMMRLLIYSVVEPQRLN